MKKEKKAKNRRLFLKKYPKSLLKLTNRIYLPFLSYLKELAECNNLNKKFSILKLTNYLKYGLKFGSLNSNKRILLTKMDLSKKHIRFRSKRQNRYFSKNIVYKKNLLKWKHRKLRRKKKWQKIRNIRSKWKKIPYQQTSRYFRSIRKIYLIIHKYIFHWFRISMTLKYRISKKKKHLIPMNNFYWDIVQKIEAKNSYNPWEKLKVLFNKQINTKIKIKKSSSLIKKKYFISNKFKRIYHYRKYLYLIWYVFSFFHSKKKKFQFLKNKIVKQHYNYPGYIYILKCIQQFKIEPLLQSPIAINYLIYLANYLRQNIRKCKNTKLNIYRFWKFKNFQNLQSKSKHLRVLNLQYLYLIKLKYLIHFKKRILQLYTIFKYLNINTTCKKKRIFNYHLEYLNYKVPIYKFTWMSKKYLYEQIKKTSELFFNYHIYNYHLKNLLVLPVKSEVNIEKINNYIHYKYNYFYI